MESKSSKTLLVTVILFAGVVSMTPLLPTRISTPISVFLLLGTLITTVTTCEFRLILDRYMTILFLILVLIFVGQSFIAGSVAMAIRLVPYVLTALLTIAILPRVVSFITAVHAIALIATGIVVIALPTALLGEISFGSLTFGSPWTNSLYGMGYQTHPIDSVLGNPNATGIAALAGTVSAVTLYTHSRQHIFTIPVIINIIGVYLSHSRLSILGLICFISLLIASKIDRSIIGMVAIVGILLGAWIPLLVIVAPYNPLISAIDLSGRDVLWNAAASAIRDRPLFGYGLRSTGDVIAEYINDPQRIGQSEHNSFLRIAVAAGLTGLGAYISIYYVALKSALKHASSVEKSMPFIFAVTMIIPQFFSAPTLFGIGLIQILVGFSVGYAVTGSAKQMHEDN